MTIEKISRGLTFKGYISAIGSVIFIIGLIITIFEMTPSISFIVCALGIFMIITGIILFFSIRGVLINSDKKFIKPYFDFIIIKIGTWESLEQYDKIVLKYSNESQTMNSRGNSTNYVTKSFDIVLTSKNKKDLIIKEFVNYDKAKLFLVEYSQRLHKENVDMYEIMKTRIQERKQQVRR
ncbi:MAG: hypothetical protein WCQ95_13975 [Bacteroidota bacterium]